jgi:hypothetical protein
MIVTTMNKTQKLAGKNDMIQTYHWEKAVQLAAQCGELL